MFSSKKGCININKINLFHGYGIVKSLLGIITKKRTADIKSPWELITSFLESKIRYKQNGIAFVKTKEAIV